MADPPDWGFAELSAPTRWLLAHGLPTRVQAPSTPLDDDAWRRVRSESQNHRLDGHLVAAVLDGSLPTTAAQRAEAGRLELALTSSRSRYDEVITPVLDALADASIPVRLIKGSALPWTDYPDPQLRPTADLDMLVRGSDLAAAVGVLVGQGGRLVNPEPSDGFARQVFKGSTVAMPSGLEVDMHRLLSWGPFGVRVPEADLWAPGRHFDRLGRAAVTLDVDRTLIGLAAHLLLLGAIRASEVRDVAQLACSPDLDPHRTLDVAHRWRHEAVLAVALRMAEHELRLATGAHPLADWAAGYRVTRRDRLWLRADRPDAPIRGLEPAAVFIELTGVRPRLTMLRATLAPRPGTDPSALDRFRRTRHRIGRTERSTRPGASESPNATEGR